VSVRDSQHVLDPLRRKLSRYWHITRLRHPCCLWRCLLQYQRVGGDNLQRCIVSRIACHPTGRRKRSPADNSVAD
jgi:hypothetical protein